MYYLNSKEIICTCLKKNCKKKKKYFVPAETICHLNRYAKGFKG